MALLLSNDSMPEGCSTHLNGLKVSMLTEMKKTDKMPPYVLRNAIFVSLMCSDFDRGTQQHFTRELPITMAKKATIGTNSSPA
mmetsp:Transcript_22840/g.41973  ORF Transcript_22840/g.41973 Transcript_22840/m.41973 type:complete len:83 (+) Transcript_22840:1193-1441(+)